MDDSGVSVTIEYVLVILITAAFFGMLLLLVNSTVRNTEQTIVGQELGVVANDIASRISEFSGKANMYGYNGDNWTSTVSGDIETIALPALAQGKQYSVEIKYQAGSKTGNVTVTYGSNVAINRTASFRSGIIVEDATIASTDASAEIYYDSSSGKIMVVGP